MNKSLISTMPAMDGTGEPTGRAERLIAQCESRLEHLLLSNPDERVAQCLAEVLRDLTAVKLELGRPRPQDKRADMRFAQTSLVIVHREGQPDTVAAMWDLSVGGVLVETDVEFADSKACNVSIPGLPDRMGCRVLAAKDGLVRLSFDKMAPSEAIALLKHAERGITRY